MARFAHLLIHFRTLGVRQVFSRVEVSLLVRGPCRFLSLKSHTGSYGALVFEALVSCVRTDSHRAQTSLSWWSNVCLGTHAQASGDHY